MKQGAITISSFYIKKGIEEDYISTKFVLTKSIQEQWYKYTIYGVNIV